MTRRGVLTDVGFTLLYPHEGEIAEIAGQVGVTVAPDAIRAAEDTIRRELASHSWASRPQSDAPPGGGVRFFRRFLALAGAAGDVDAAARRLWTVHLERNLWRRVGDGVERALVRLRAAGWRVAAVSNSEGTVERLLGDVGLGGLLDAVVDSWAVGLAKPDPRIFRLALDRLGVDVADAVMVGDSPSADVDGARAIGLRAALIDDLGLHPSVAPRHASFSAFVDSLVG